MNIPHILQVPPWEDKDYGIRKPKQLDEVAIDDFPDLILKSDSTTIPKQYAKNLLGILFKSDIKKNSLSIVKSDFQEMTNAITPDSLQAFGNTLYKKNGLHGLKYAWICQLTQSHIDDIRTFIDDNKYDGGNTLACRDLLRVLAINFQYTRSIPALRELVFQHQKGKKRFRSLANDLINEVRDSFDSYYSYEDVVDYVTPTFGFDSFGTMTLSFSDKTVIIELDNHLTPTLFLNTSNDNGQDKTVIKSLPRATKNDDKDDFQRKKADYKKTIRDINNLYKQKIKSLNAELHTPIYRKTSQFLTIYLQNPLLNLMAQSLVWGIYQTESSKEHLETFVIANDGDWLDSHYNVIDQTAYSNNYIALIHPAYLDETEQVRFQNILNDFQILQPFEQMFMQVFRLSTQEKQDNIISRFQGKTLSGEYFEDRTPSVVTWNDAFESYDHVGFNFSKPLMYGHSDYLTITFIEQTSRRTENFQIQDIDITSCDDPLDLHMALFHLTQSVLY